MQHGGAQVRETRQSLKQVESGDWVRENHLVRHNVREAPWSQSQLQSPKSRRPPARYPGSRRPARLESGMSHPGGASYPGPAPTTNLRRASRPARPPLLPPPPPLLPPLTGAAPAAGAGDPGPSAAGGGGAGVAGAPPLRGRPGASCALHGRRGEAPPLSAQRAAWLCAGGSRPWRVPGGGVGCVLLRGPGRSRGRGGSARAEMNSFRKLR